MNEIEKHIEAGKQHIIKTKQTLRHILDELCNSTALQECRLTSYNHGLGWDEHCSIVKSTTFTPKWNWNATLIINSEPKKEPLSFRFKMWWTVKKLRISYWLWNLRGLKACPRHGFSTQSWLTGKCRRCKDESVQKM